MRIAEIRPEIESDRAPIHALHAASFPSDGEARLVDGLRDAGRLWLSLVAISDDAVVGHVAFSPVSVLGADGGVGLGPIAVAPAHRRCGMAARLVEEGLEACRRAGRTFIVVLGDPAYYGRFGFLPASHWGLRDEFGGGDAFQAMELRRDSIPRRGGIVQYAPEFAVLG